MAYDPENNPYIPGDPASYDLKWVIDRLNEHKFAEESAADAKASAEAAEASAQEASGYADDAEGYRDAASGFADDAADSADEAADYAAHIADPVSGLVTSWLEDNITQPTTPAIDTSLSVAGAAADAAVTGDEFENIRDIENLYTNFGGDWYKNITGSIKLTKTGNKLKVEGTKAGSNAYYGIDNVYETASAVSGLTTRSITLTKGHYYMLIIKKTNTITTSTASSYFAIYGSDNTSIGAIYVNDFNSTPIITRLFKAQDTNYILTLRATAGGFSGAEFEFWIQDISLYMDGIIDGAYDNILPPLNQLRIGYVDSSGNITGTTLGTEYCTGFIPIQEDEAIAVQTKTPTAEHDRAQYFMIGFYSDASASDFISRSAELDFTAIDGDYTIDSTRVTAPAGSKYARISFRRLGTNMEATATRRRIYANSFRINSDDYLKWQIGRNIVKPHDKIRSINHRGWHLAPENTLPAYRASYEQGFDCVECDVRFTSDNVPVLLHDASINRTARNMDGTTIGSTVNIDSITYAQALTYDFGIYKGAAYAGTPIPTLAEFLATCRNLGLIPYIEIEGDITDAYANILYATASESGIAENITWISASDTSLRKMARLMPENRFGLIPWTYSADTLNMAKMMVNGKGEIFIDIQISQLTSAIIADCAAANIPLEGWVTDTASVITSLDPYISGVTSNELVASEVLKAYELAQ